MNPDTNKFELLKEALRMSIAEPQLLRPDGTPVPKHWSVFKVGEQVVVKDYTFKVGYINETTLVLEPVGPVVIGESDDT